MVELRGFWKKGSLHNHTLWSDGATLPEVAIKRIKDSGYDFLCLTDHNIFQDIPDAWVEVRPEAGNWPPAFSQSEWEFAQSLGIPLDYRHFGYTTSVRLRTFKELRRLFHEPGKFLLIPGGEITTRIRRCNDRPGVFQLHMNYFNIQETLPDLVGKNLDETVKLNFNSYKNSAAKVKGVTAFQFNHPLWPRYDGPPELLIDNPEIRHVEICNNTIDFDRPEGMYDCSKYWDIVNAFRCINGDQLCFASAGDDSHRYDPERINGIGGVGSAWVMVHLPGRFTVNNLLTAMNNGEYYPTTGVILDSIKFEPETGKLSVKVAGNGKFCIRFITTEQNFNRETEEHYFPWVDDFDRRLRKYSDDIGVCVKEVKDVSEAEYTMSRDDLYVRAEIISDVPGRFDHFPYPEKQMAWTQPYRMKS